MGAGFGFGLGFGVGDGAGVGFGAGVGSTLGAGVEFGRVGSEADCPGWADGLGFGFAAWAEGFPTCGADPGAGRGVGAGPPPAERGTAAPTGSCEDVASVVAEARYP